jgi:hypothetical protein
MKIWRILVAAPLALIASQALAENWVTVGSTGIRVDKDSLRRGDDGLVYFSDNIGMDFNKVGINEALAMDCQRRLTYVLKSDGHLSAGSAVKPNSIEDAELQYVCAEGKP